MPPTMNPVVVPYDPPVKSRRDSIRRDSFLHEVEDGFERVATVADKVEHYAHEVEKGAQFGRHLVQELDDEYGAELQRRPPSRKAPAGPPGYNDHDHKQTLPSSSTSASAPRGAQDPKHLLIEVRTATTLMPRLQPERDLTPILLRTLIQPIPSYRSRLHRTRSTGSCMIWRGLPSCATS